MCKRPKTIAVRSTPHIIFYDRDENPVTIYEDIIKLEADNE